MQKKQRGIVIRRVAYGESHLIVTFLSEYGVKVPVMARNARKSKRFGASLDLFYENLFIYSQFTGMGTLSSVDTINSHYNLRSDIFRLTYAEYIAELIDRSMEAEEVDIEAFQLLKFGLDQLTNDQNPAVIAMIVSLKLMPKFGYRMQFHHPDDPSAGFESFIGYSVKLNLPMTKKTWSQDPHTIQVSNKALYFLYLFCNMPLEQFRSTNIAEETIKEMEQLVFLVYDEFIGVHLKSRNILKQL